MARVIIKDQSHRRFHAYLLSFVFLYPIRWAAQLPPSLDSKLEVIRLSQFKPINTKFTTAWRSFISLWGIEGSAASFRSSSNAGSSSRRRSTKPMQYEKHFKSNFNKELPAYDWSDMTETLPRWDWLTGATAHKGPERMKLKRKSCWRSSQLYTGSRIDTVKFEIGVSTNSVTFLVNPSTDNHYQHQPSLCRSVLLLQTLVLANSKHVSKARSSRFDGWWWVAHSFIIYPISYGPDWSSYAESSPVTSVASLVTWHVIVWILISLAINSMVQPSGHICGATYRYRLYLSSSPILCAVDALSAIIRLIATSICFRISPSKHAI